MGDCVDRAYLDLGLGEEPGPDLEGDDVVARHGADGAAHEGAPVRVAVVDLAAEGVVVVRRLPPRPESEERLRNTKRFRSRNLQGDPSGQLKLPGDLDLADVPPSCLDSR